MTVQETILSFPGLSGFSDGFLVQILAGRSIDGAADAKTVGVSQINLAIADTLVFAANMPDFTENKLSIKYPREYFIKTARMLYLDSGEPDKAKGLGRVRYKPGKASNKW